MLLREKLILHVLDNMSVNQLRDSVLKLTVQNDNPFIDPIYRIVKENFLTNIEDISSLFSDIGFINHLIDFPEASTEQIIAIYQDLVAYTTARILMGDLITPFYLCKKITPYKIKECINLFKSWSKNNLIFDEVINYEDIEDIFGFPYIESDKYALLMNATNTVAKWKFDDSYSFLYLCVNVIGEPVAVFSNDSDDYINITIERF